MAKSVADIRKRFLRLKNELRMTADNEAKVVTARTAPKQLTIDRNGWSGDVYDTAGMTKPFERVEHNADVVKGVSSVNNPGTVGDLALSSLQGDFLAAFERAFRLLNATPVRLAVHAAAREYGHGHAAGVLSRGLDTYLAGFAKIAKRDNQ